MHRQPIDHQHTDDITDRGLAFDLRTLMQRRHALKLFAGAAALTLVGCGSDETTAPTATAPAATTPTTAATSATAAATSAAATAIATATALVSPIPTGATPASACTGALPEETAGPFPGDGSNGPNVLTESGIVRNDIRASFAGATGQAAGVPLTIRLTVVDTNNGCAPMPGATVYLWHCDKDGLYSMYSQGATEENYLRGVQAADANGVLTFTTIFPGAYLGRWPHAHFEIYPSLEVANASGNAIATSQLALPDDVCKTVYATAGYEQSAINHPRTTLTSDGIFRDGYDLQMVTITGSVAAGYTASLVVGVAA